MKIKDIYSCCDEFETIQILQVNHGKYYQIYFDKVMNIPDDFSNYNIIKHSLALELDADGYPYLIVSVYEG